MGNCTLNPKEYYNLFPYRLFKTNFYFKNKESLISLDMFFKRLVVRVFGFYGVATFVGYLTPNSVCMYIHSIYI